MSATKAERKVVADGGQQFDQTSDLVVELHNNNTKEAYLRNNKSAETKNLRCFPDCCYAGHRMNSFCGQSIIASISSSAKGGKDLFAVGELRPIESLPSDGSPSKPFFDDLENEKKHRAAARISCGFEDGQVVSSKYFDKPGVYSPYYIGLLTEKSAATFSPEIDSRDPSSSTDSDDVKLSGSAMSLPSRKLHYLAEFNTSPKNWTYSYESSKYTTETQHAFHIHVFQQLSPNTGSGDLVYLDSFRGPSFRIGCMRKMYAPSGGCSLAAASAKLRKKSSNKNNDAASKKKKAILTASSPSRSSSLVTGSALEYRQSLLHHRQHPSPTGGIARKSPRLAVVEIATTSRQVSSSSDEEEEEEEEESSSEEYYEDDDELWLPSPRRRRPHQQRKKTTKAIVKKEERGPATVPSEPLPLTQKNSGISSVRSPSKQTPGGSKSKAIGATATTTPSTRARAELRQKNVKEQPQSLSRMPSHCAASNNLIKFPPRKPGSGLLFASCSQPKMQQQQQRPPTRPRSSPSTGIAPAAVVSKKMSHSIAPSAAAAATTAAYARKRSRSYADLNDEEEEDSSEEEEDDRGEDDGEFFEDNPNDHTGGCATAAPAAYLSHSSSSSLPPPPFSSSYLRRGGGVGMGSGSQLKKGSPPSLLLQMKQAEECADYWELFPSSSGGESFTGTSSTSSSAMVAVASVESAASLSFNNSHYAGGGGNHDSYGTSATNTTTEDAGAVVGMDVEEKHMQLLQQLFPHMNVRLHSKILRDCPDAAFCKA